MLYSIEWEIFSVDNVRWEESYSVQRKWGRMIVYHVEGWEIMMGDGAMLWNKEREKADRKWEKWDADEIGGKGIVKIELMKKNRVKGVKFCI